MHAWRLAALPDLRRAIGEQSPQQVEFHKIPKCKLLRVGRLWARPSQVTSRARRAFPPYVR
jgi:hypothetical protein